MDRQRHLYCYKAGLRRDPPPMLRVLPLSPLIQPPPLEGIGVPFCFSLYFALLLLLFSSALIPLDRVRT